MQGGIQGEGRREARRLEGGLHAGIDPQATGKPGGLAGQTKGRKSEPKGDIWKPTFSDVRNQIGLHRKLNALCGEI